MRIPLAFALVLGTAATATAQNPPAVVRYTPGDRSTVERFTGTVRVVATEGSLRAVMPAAAEPYDTDWPLATVPARGLKAGVDPTVPEFRIRAWAEGDAVRALVFTAIASGPEWEVREQQIASVLVPINEFVEVAATEQYLARPLTLTAYRD